MARNVTPPMRPYMSDKVSLNEEEAPRDARRLSKNSQGYLGALRPLDFPLTVGPVPTRMSLSSLQNLLQRLKYAKRFLWNASSIADGKVAILP